jgi:hypothetical protein
MAPAVGFLFHRRFKRRFMHHHVHALSQRERRRARGRIAKNRQLFAGLRCGEIILPVDDAPVLQRDGLAVLQTLEQRPGFTPSAISAAASSAPGLSCASIR